MRLLIALGIALLLLAPPRAAAQERAPDTLRVAIKPLTPFVNYVEEDRYTGFSIDLWQEIARRNDWETRYVPFDSVSQVLDAVRYGGAEIGIAGISITRQREEFVDFSQPMFNAGLQIMVPMRGSSTTLDVLLTLFSPELLIIPIIMLVVIVVIGHVIWLVERKNPDFPDDYLPGVGEGVWWAASSLLGSQDKMPRSLVGRLGALVWIITGIILIAFLTANLTAQSTVEQLQSSVRGIDDLPGKRIATVGDSTAARFLEDRRILFTPVPTIEEAYQRMLDGDLDAVVYDAPVLRHFAFTEGSGRVSLVGGLLQREDYGIATASGSRYRELIDRALLEMIEDGTYTTLVERYFGGES